MKLKLNIFILLAFCCGIILFLTGQIITQPILNHLSVLSLSFGGILIGLDAIKNQIYREKSRYTRKETETYTGFAATLKGIILIFIGLFLSIISFAFYFNFTNTITEYFSKQPGISLVVIGITCFTISVTTIIGYVEQNRGSKFEKILDLIFNRLIPSIILALISIALLIFGFILIYDQKNLDRIVRKLIEFVF